MSAELQTGIALGLVALAALYLLRAALKKRKNPGCGSDCGAVSADVKKLRDRLTR